MSFIVEGEGGIGTTSLKSPRQHATNIFIRTLLETMATPEFVFSEENFRKPDLPVDLDVVDVPLVAATEESLKGFGKVRRGGDGQKIMLMQTTLYMT